MLRNLMFGLPIMLLCLAVQGCQFLERSLLRAASQGHGR